MNESKSNLSSADVQKLLSDPSPDARAATAAKVASDFDTSRLSDGERQIAEDIFRLMVKDAEVRVREALAENPEGKSRVCRMMSPAPWPRTWKPFPCRCCNFPEVLSDADLVEIIRDQDETKAEAIAKRKTVSETVSGALVETGNENVVTTLVSNKGAEISESSLTKVVEDFGASGSGPGSDGRSGQASGDGDGAPDDRGVRQVQGRPGGAVRRFRGHGVGSGVAQP